jgi:hypothetical protein
MSLAAPEFRAAEPMDALLTRVVLPRYGHVIRKLSLRGTDVRLPCAAQPGYTRLRRCADV